MATDIGMKLPDNKIVARGDPFVEMLEVETATNCTPGRIAKKGTTDADVIVNAGEDTEIGVFGYEQADPTVLDNASGVNRSVAGTYAAGDWVPVLSGPMLCRLSVKSTCGAVTKGEELFAVAAGQVTNHGTTPCARAAMSLAAGGGNILAFWMK